MPTQNNTPAASATLSAEECSAIFDECFKKVRGLDLIKQKLKRKILGARVDGFLKSTLLVGYPGSGKSKLMKAYKDACRACLGRSTISFDEGSACGTKVSFVEEVLVPQFTGKARVLAIDEVHTSNPKVLHILRRMIQPDADRSTVTFIPHADYEIEFNPSLNSLIIATNQVDKLDDAFISRFDRLDLPMYSDDELELIYQDCLGDCGIRFAESTLKRIAACGRGSARDVIHWIDAIKEFCAINGRKQVNKAEANEIIRLQSTYPLGVTVNELRTLLLLEDGEMQLKELAAANIINTKEQNANEKYLLQRQFIAIESKRRLTGAGALYLAELRDEGFIPKKAHKAVNA